MCALRVPSRAPILRACFPEGKIVHGISPSKVWRNETDGTTFVLIGSTIELSQTSNSSKMNNFNFQDCRKAVNQVTFRPTAERKAAAAKLLQEALDFVNNLEEVVEKPSKKATKRRRKTTRKATPTQRVADRQEKAFHGKADTPVKPSKKARTASVEAARESAKAVSVATGAAAKAAKKAELRSATAERSDVAAQPSVDSSRLSSLEEKIEMLTQLMALQMQGEQSTSVKAESLEELPFQI